MIGLALLLIKTDGHSSILSTMDSEHLHDPAVFGLDNADPLQELYIGDESNPVTGRGPSDVWSWPKQQTLVVQEAAIEKEADKAEIAKLREELSKALELNRTITASYRELLLRNADKTPQKSETKRKLYTLLQEELEEKNIYCMTVSSKLNNYKKKYQALKQKLAKLQPKQSESVSIDSEPSKIQLLELENEQLKQRLRFYKTNEAQIVQRLKEAEGRIASGGSSGGLADHSLIIDKLKMKANSFNRDADKIFESITSLKDVIGDLVGTTPSTNWREDEAIMIEIPQPTKGSDEGHLGKRQSLKSEEQTIFKSSDLQGTMDQETTPTEAPVIETVNEKPRLQSESSEEVELPKTEKKTAFKIDHGSSEDEESSLSSSYKSLKIDQIDSKLKQLTVHCHQVPVWNAQKTVVISNSPWKSSEEADKVNADTKVDATCVPVVSMMEEQTVKPDEAKSLEAEPRQENIMTPHPASSTWYFSQPVSQKAVVPSFLLSNSTKPTLNLKPVGVHNDQSLLENKPTGNRSTSIGKNTMPESPKKVASECFDRAWKFLERFRLSSIHDSEQKIEFFTILSKFREETKVLTAKPAEQKSSRKALLDQLLQKDLKLQAYSLKDLTQLPEFEAAIGHNYHCLVFQSIFFVVFISCFENESLTPEETELSDYFLQYRNRSEYLAEKFDKLVEIFKLSKTNPAAKKQNTSSKSYCHHFPLLKIVFNNMIFAMERQTVVCPTDGEFRSDLLARKRNITELRDSCLYSMKNLARSNLEFKFFAELPDFLGAVKRIFEFSRALNFNMTKIYFDALKGFFCHKYRNTSQQIVTFLLLGQLNQLEKSAIN